MTSSAVTIDGQLGRTYRDELPFIAAAGLLGTVGALTQSLLGSALSGYSWLGFFAFINVIFAGLVVRKPGAIVLSALIAAVPTGFVSMGSALLLGLGSPVQALQGVLLALLVTAFIGEVIGLFLWTRPAGLVTDCLMAVAAIAGNASLVVGMWSWFGGVDLGRTLDWLGGVNVFLIFAAPIVATVIVAVSAQKVRAVRSARHAAEVVWVGDRYQLLPPHPMASVVMMFGVAGLVAFGPAAPLAWWLGALARRQAAANPGRYRTSGALDSGYLLGIVGMALISLWCVLVWGTFSRR